MPEQRPYQEEGTEFHLQHPRSMNGDEMGLGKTNQLLKVDEHIKPRTKLILCSKNALYTWKRESALWTPDLPQPTMVIGTPEERRRLWHAPYVSSTFGTFIRDFEYVKAIKKGHFDVINVDEAHKARNRKSKAFMGLKQLHADYLIQASGSFVARGAQDLYTHLNLCNPRVFSSYWKYVKTFCHVENTPYGQEIVMNKNVNQLKSMLKEFLILRTKKQVGQFMPPKTRQPFDILMEPWEKKLYDQLQHDMLFDVAQYSVDDLSEPRYFMQSSVLGKIIALRKMLITPQMLDPSLPIGSCLESIGEWIMDQDEPNRHVVIFTPFRDGIQIAKKYLEGLKTKHPIYILQGGTHPNEIGRVEEAFRTGEGIVLCTTRFAQSFSLETAKVGIMWGCEYDPEDNKQAEDRLHRFTTKHPVNIYYTNHPGTFEDRVFEILNDKNRNSTEITADLTNFRTLMSLFEVKL